MIPPAGFLEWKREREGILSPGKARAVIPVLQQLFQLGGRENEGGHIKGRLSQQHGLEEEHRIASLVGIEIPGRGKVHQELRFIHIRPAYALLLQLAKFRIQQGRYRLGNLR